MSNQQRSILASKEATDFSHDCPLHMPRGDLFRLIRWTMWIHAMYPWPLARFLPHCLEPLASLVSTLHELFLYFVVLHIDILYMCTIFLNLNAGNLELLVSCMIQTVIYTWAFIIMVFFKRISNQQIHELMLYMNAEYRTHSACGLTYMTFKQSFAMSNKWARVYLGCCYMGVIFWLFMPAVNQDRSLPLPCWYPIDYQAPVVYEILYFLQIVGQLQIAGAFGITSALYMMVAILLSGQYDILNCSLKNIIATAYINMRSTPQQLLFLKEHQAMADLELNQYYCSEESYTDQACLTHLLDSVKTAAPNFKIAFQLAFKPCVTHHRFILRCLNMLESLYYFIWFFKTFEVTLLICLVAFVWVKSTASYSMLRVLSLGQYLILVLWEMFIICYSGEIIHLNSQRCDEALLRSPWYLHMREMKTNALFFLLNAQRPYRLTAGKMFNLNLSRFRNILTTSFSFLTLLQKMDLRNSP